MVMHDSKGSVRVVFEQTDSGRAIWIRKAVFARVAGFWSLLRDGGVDGIGAAEGATRGRAPDEGNARSSDVPNTLDMSLSSICSICIAVNKASVSAAWWLGRGT